jgi:hypothetical protein
MITQKLYVRKQLLLVVLFVLCFAGTNAQNLDSQENVLRTKEIKVKDKIQLYSDLADLTLN